jgi:glycosyltransferase involved in cell wall biosynthesis
MVLHVIKSNIYSGAENVVCQIIKGLSDREEFIYMAPHGPIEDKLKSIGLINCYRGIDKLSVYEIKKAVEELHPTVVHAHDFTASVLCGIALKGSVPIVSHLHNNPPWIKDLNIKSIAYKMACKCFNHILMVSDAVYEEYRYTSKIKCPITIIGNPFSVDGVRSQVADFTFTGTVTENDFDCDSNDELDSDILFVGRLTEQKDPMMVVEVASELIKNGVIKRARLVGDGELYEQLSSFVKGAGLEDKIILEGFKKNSYDYMAHTKVQIMPSKWEGFGLVALEAMSLNVPVVGTDNGGLGKIIDSSCGYVCHTKEEYVNAITELLSDSALYAKKSTGANARALEYNNINEYCDKLFNIYEELR